MAAMIFQAPPQFGQCSMSMSKTRLSKPGPAHARRRALQRERPRLRSWGCALVERKRFYCATSHCLLEGIVIGHDEWKPRKTGKGNAQPKCNEN
jgi:hypothetical protein